MYYKMGLASGTTVALTQYHSMKCYECSKDFAKQPDGSNMQPQYDIVIRHANYRQYYYEGEKRSTKQKQNTYFHPSLTCIMSKYRSFNPQLSQHLWGQGWAIACAYCFFEQQLWIAALELVCFCDNHLLFEKCHVTNLIHIFNQA